MTNRHVLEYSIVDGSTPDVHEQFVAALTDLEEGATVSHEPKRTFVEAGTDTHNRIGQKAMQLGMRISLTPY